MCVLSGRSVAAAVYAKRSKDGKGKAEFIDMTKEIGEAMTYSTPCSMGQNSSRIALTAVENLQESMRHISRRKLSCRCMFLNGNHLH